jgi:hypothetical protein
MTKGYCFALSSERNDRPEEDNYDMCVAECCKLPDENSLFIHGVEYNCQSGVHLPRYGMAHYLPRRVSSAVSAESQLQGAIGVVAHPARARYRFSGRLLAPVNGIEIWSSKIIYDGRRSTRLPSWHS